MKSIDEIIADIKSTADKATPGDWRRSSFEFNSIVSGEYSITGRGVELNIARTPEKRDAEYISAANPVNISALLSHIDTLDARITELEALKEDWYQEAMRLQDLADRNAGRITDLESRTVKLPHADMPLGFHPIVVAASDKANAMRRKCIKAIVSAGVKVEGE